MSKPNHLSLSLLALASCLLPAAAFAGGACCSLASADPSRLNLTLVGASARNHEMIAGATYELAQQALMLKLGKPLGRGFVLQAQAGLPVSTELSHQAAKLRGKGGFIYGAGLGYKLPRFLGPVDFFASVSYSRALGYLDRDNSGALDQSFQINEFQTVFTGETSLTSKLYLYGGLRAYSGKAQLKNNKTGGKLNGDQEGNYAGLAGIRRTLSDKLSLVVDAGFGHTKVIGVGAILSF